MCSMYFRETILTFFMQLSPRNVVQNLVQVITPKLYDKLIFDTDEKEDQ